MLYICIYNEDLHKIEYKEKYDTDTDEKKEWAQKNFERLWLECMVRRPENWLLYASEKSQFSWTKI